MKYVNSITLHVMTVDYAMSVMNVRKVMSEPQLDDPIATGESDECDECGCFIYECVCNEPDRMYGDED